MNRKTITAAELFVFTVLLGASLSGCSREQHTETRAAEMVSGVPVLIIHKTTVPDWLEAIGTIRAAQSSQAASQVIGNIREIRVQEGDRVQAGQILATIDDSQRRAAVDQAKASVAAAEKQVSAADSDLALATSTLKRYQQLYEKKSLSPQEFDEVKAREQSAEAHRDGARAMLEQSNAALVEARTMLGYTAIAAPLAGMVTEKKADPGMLVSPGMPLFSIEDTRSYRLEVTVNEADIHLVRPGQRASVSLDAPGVADLPGRVEQIIPIADPASRSLLVKIDLPADARLRSGLFGRVRFPKGERQALLIPTTAIIERGQLQGIYVIDEKGMAALRYVTVGRPAESEVEVLSGLQDGENIVANPGTRELSGKQIAVRP